MERTPGLNQIPTEVLKVGAGTLCVQLCALTTKAVAHCKEPLEWKGGLLVPLSKGKADAADPLGYRSIFISNFTAKLYHMALRAHLVEIWEQGISSLQLGGRRKRGADLAHHILQAHGHWATCTRKPYAHLFFDIRSAFYSVLRQALFPDEEYPSSLVAALHRLRVSSADIDHMLEVTSTDDATAGVSDHFRRLLKDALTNTHFFIRGLDAPCRTHRGTRPGDPLGDLLYNMVMSLILRDARNLIHKATGVFWAGSPQACADLLHPDGVPPEAIIDLAFVDDCAMAIHSSTLHRVQDIVKAAVGAMDAAAKGRGLLLNFAPGKTEVILHLVGKGSAAAKVQLQESSQRLIWEQDSQQFQLRVVHCYKHLGTWLQQGAKSSKEVVARGTAARQSWGALHRSLYAKSYVSIKAKMTAFESLSMSRLMYNCHVWAPVTDTMVHAWQNSIRKPLGLFARGHSFGVSPLLLDVETLCGLLHILPPADRLHMARLRYLRRLVQVAPNVLWQLLMETKDKEDSWINACERSFDWFRRFYSDHIGLPADNNLASWLPIVSLDANWFGRVKAAGAACRRFRQATAESVTWQKRFDTAFTEAGGVLPARPLPCAERWTCDQCDKWFGSRRALATHSARVHGYRRLVKLYAVGDTCQACCRCYHNRSRLAEHLRDATLCLETLQHCFPPVDDDHLAQLDAQEQQDNAPMKADGWGATKALHPMRKLLGPRLPPPHSAAAHEMFQKYMQRSSGASEAATLLQGRRDGPVSDSPQVQVFAEDFPAFVMNVPAGFPEGDGRYDLGGLAHQYAWLSP